MKKNLLVKGEKGLKILFNHKNPDKICRAKSLINLSKEELKKALKKPFYLMTDLQLAIVYENVEYNITIPVGFDWNGANVPPFAWLLIGQQKDPRFKVASCVHDYVCENHELIENNRYLSTLVFIALCKHIGRFNNFKLWAMKHSVDNFQKFCGWGE